MPEHYNTETSKILELWLQRLQNETQLDRLLVQQINEMVQNGTAGSPKDVQALAAALKEQADGPH